MIPGEPSPRAHSHELADFAEIQAWLKGECSQREVQRQQEQLDDNLESPDKHAPASFPDTEYDGIPGPEDDIEQMADYMVTELEERSNACEAGYPFRQSRNGNVLIFSPDNNDLEKSDIYLFLLLATRLNMKDCKVQGGHDGTLLFEALSAKVLQNYLGASRAEGVVFGTAAGNRFKDKINDMCERLEEGGSFSNPDSASPTKNDDALDVVAWIPFADRRASKLSIFAQCKTGTNWTSSKGDLRPGDFLKSWTRKGSFALDPVRSFFVAEAIDRSRWNSTVTSAGLFFDRCRIVSFAEKINPDLLAKIHEWTEAAKISIQGS